MNCCRKNVGESGSAYNKATNSYNNKDDDEFPTVCYEWYPDRRKEKKITYIRRLERKYEALQSCYFDLSTEMARLQFCIRQIIEASPKDRNRMINDLERKFFKDVDNIGQVYGDNFPTLAQHDIEMGDLRRKQHHLMDSLRKQVGSLEKASENLPTEEQQTNIGNLSKQASKAKMNSKTQLRQGAGLDTHFAIKPSSSIETYNSSQQSIIAVRSASFKELQEIYNKGMNRQTQ